MSLCDRRYQDVLEYHLSPVFGIFNDKAVTDIEVNPDESVFVHMIDGTSRRLDIHIAHTSIAAAAALLASRTQNDVTDSSPSVAAVWPDPPMRIHIMLPPAVAAPCMVIRRFSATVFLLSHFTEMGTCTQSQEMLMRQLVSDRRNIIVSGETGAGKTTLINSLLGEIPSSDRLYIIEDTRELQCFAPNHVSVLTGEKYSARMAIKDAMRFRPDRIIVGEVRDGAALDMLEAWNTGHPGGICSIHANSSDTVKQRLRSLVQQVSVSPQDALIDMAVNAVIQISLCSDGKRRITEIRTFQETET